MVVLLVVWYLFLNKIFLNQSFVDFQREMYKSIGSANDLVITPIKKCHKERSNQEDSTKRETSKCHTLVKNLFNTNHRHVPTSCSLMLVDNISAGI